MSSVNGDFPPGSDDHVGHLLWAALQRARADGMALIAVDAEVAGPLSPSHARLLERLPPEGARVTELASRTRITKQALGQLASQLADRGYVQIVRDPCDRRAKLVRCTQRGQRARHAIRAAAAALEGRWRAQVGEARYAVFREVLAELGSAHLRAEAGDGKSADTAEGA
jgi:DNA-binding MarR family transcriptional regulator